MKRFACWLTVSLCFLMTGVSPAQEKVNEQVLKELAELRAEVKALKARVAKLEGDEGMLIPTVSAHDKKWIGALVDDYMREMLVARPYSRNQNRFKDASRFLAQGASAHTKTKDVNVTVTYSGVGGSSSGHREVYMDYVFQKYQIDSELVAPGKEEVLVRGKLKGNIGQLHREESYEMKTTINEGSLGERTGAFTMRVGRENGANRWAITYFVFTVDEIKKIPEK